MIPDFYDGEFLPDGDHEATWSEVQARFGNGERRQGLCEQMQSFIQSARGCHLLAVYLFGSFISGKQEPGDIDLMWVYSADGFEDLSPECKDLLNYVNMKARWNWDMFAVSDTPGCLEYLLAGWREDKDKTKRRGIIKIDLQMCEGLE